MADEEANSGRSSGSAAIGIPDWESLAQRDLHRTPEVAKVEVVCRDEDVQSLIDTLVTAARTGVQEDGIVFVTPVTSAIKIRTGAAGDAALARPEPAS